MAKKRNSGNELDPMSAALQEACDKLADAAWSFLSADELATQAAWRIIRTYSTAGSKEIAKELYLMHIMLDCMKQIVDPAMEQIRNGLEAMKTGTIAKPIKLALPVTRYEHFRRQLLKSLLNAVKAKGADGERHELHLGEIWFRSSDDAPALKASADALTRIKE